MPISTSEQLNLAKRVRDHILAHPEQHDQRVWFYSPPDCGTAACIAGWTAVLDGAQLLPDEDDDSDPYDEFFYVAVDGGIPTSIPNYAKSALGLTTLEARRLFDCQSSEAALDHLDELIGAGEARLSGASA